MPGKRGARARRDASTACRPGRPLAAAPRSRVWQRDGQGRKLALCLDRYFDSGPAVCDWNMARLKYPWRTPFRRFTLTEWAGLIRAADFVIWGLHEPRPDAAAVARHPE